MRRAGPKKYKNQLKSAALKGAATPLNASGYALNPQKGFAYNLVSFTASSATKVVMLTIQSVAAAAFVSMTGVQGFVSGNYSNKVASVNVADNHGIININSDSFSSPDSGRVAAAHNGCEYASCDNFCDLSKWTSHPNLSIASTCPVVIAPIVDGKQRGGLMYFKDLVLTPGFATQFDFRPCGSKQSNIVVRYAGFEYRIGEGNYRSIKLFSNGTYIPPKGFETRKYYNLTESIKPCTPVQLHLEILMPGGSYTSRAIVVRSSVAYEGISGTRHEGEGVPEFVVPTKDDVWKIQGLLGVGVSDWQKTGDITAIFESIKIDNTRL